MNDSTAAWDEPLHPGQGWSRIIRRHHALRLTPQHDGACVSLLAFSAANTAERYNMPDSLKAQHTAFLTAGRVLMSDMGTVLLAIMRDDCGWHDPICGHARHADVAAHGPLRSYQEARNRRTRVAHDNFLIELAKHDLSARDLHACLNLFAKVVCDDHGCLHHVPNHARAGQVIELRAEQDVLVILTNTPHPLDRAGAEAVPVQIAIAAVAAPGPDDRCRLSRPENERAYRLTEARFAPGLVVGAPS